MADGAILADKPVRVGRAWLPGLLVLARFGLAGILNTIFGYAVFAVLVVAGVWSSGALVAATLAGVAFNFQTSRRLVFGADGRPLRFVVLYGSVLLLNLVALRVLREIGLAELWSQAALALPVAALSFLGQRVWVFGRAGRG